MKTYDQLYLVYDDIKQTTNRNILEVSSAGKIGYVTRAGKVILECLYKPDQLKIDKDIVEFTSKDKNKYQIYRVTVSRDNLSYKARRIFEIKIIDGAYRTVVKSGLSNDKESKIYIKSVVMPSLVNVTKSAVCLYLDNLSGGVIIVGKNKKIYNSKKYLNVVDVDFRNELLGINYITVEKSGPIRRIDILDRYGKLIRETTWTASDKATYKVGITDLYSRKVRKLNDKGELT